MHKCTSTTKFSHSQVPQDTTKIRTSGVCETNPHNQNNRSLNRFFLKSGGYNSGSNNTAYHIVNKQVSLNIASTTTTTTNIFSCTKRGERENYAVLTDVSGWAESWDTRTRMRLATCRPGQGLIKHIYTLTPLHTDTQSHTTLTRNQSINNEVRS